MTDSLRQFDVVDDENWDGNVGGFELEAVRLKEKLHRKSHLKLFISRFGSFLFQGQMHALMTTILLRGAWFDPFDADAQSQPPDCKPAEVE